MKKSLLFLGILIFVSTGIFAQYSKLSNLGRMPKASHSKALSGTISSTTLNYIPGTTFDIQVNYNHVTPDDEWVDGISLDFPLGVSVNSGADFELVCNGETGDGVLVTWGSMTGGSGAGDLSSSTSFTVNVTVDAGFTGDITVDYAVVGDGYGTDPHTLAGSFTITEAAGYDAGITSVSPIFVMEGETAYPSVVIVNYGANTIDDFDVQIVVNDGTSDVYTSTLNVTGAGLTFGNNNEFVMTDLWTPANGNYTITATVVLSGDANTANDEMSVSCLVGSYSTAHAANGTDGAYGIFDLSDGTYTSTGTILTDPFPMAEEFDGNSIWRVNSDLTFGIVDPIGNYTLIGTMSGVAGTPTGLAYDFDNDVMYTVILDASNLPQLCTVDLTTGNCTLVGTGAEGMIIGIDFAIDGFIYGPDLNDNLYKIDPATGAVTLIGAVGIDLNYGQDVSYDYQTLRLYTVTCGAVYEFGYYDLTTGAFTSIADMAGDQYATFVVTNLPIGPAALSHTPESDLTDVALDATVSVTFNVNITEVDFTGISITPDPGNVVASIVDNVLTLAHDAFAFNTEYTVLVPTGAVSDGTDNLAYDVEWSFTTMLDPTACNDPSNILVTDVDVFEATVSWVENGAGTQWIVLYGPAGFDPMTEGDQLTVDVTNTPLTGLTANTEYEVYVQALCGAETSGWAGPATFTTLYDCSTVVGIDEGFEMQVAPVCWDNYQAGAGSKVWAQETTIFNSGSACAAAYYEASAGINEQWLVTNEVNVPVSYRLMFYTRDSYTTDYASTLSVKISTDGGTVFANLLTIAETDVTNTEFTAFNIDLTAYEGQDVKFAFVMTDDDGDNWYLDDVSLSFYNDVENNFEDVVSIYPNPSNGLVNISVTENSVVSVMDVAGRTVAMYNVNANEQVSFTQSAGMYIVKVESNGKVSTHKLVIE